MSTFETNSDILEIIKDYKYWNTEIDALWIQFNIPEDDESDVLSSAFNVRIKTDNVGFYINGHLIFTWDSEHTIDEENFIDYPVYDYGAIICLLPSGNILCSYQYEDDKRDNAGIEFNGGSSTKSFRISK